MSLETRIADYRDANDSKAIVFLMREYANLEGCDRDDLAELPELLSQIDRGFSVLAYQGANPVGLINCFYGFSTFELRVVVNIHDVIVTESHRGRGVAGVMLARVESESRSRDACRLTLEVLDDNVFAKRAYEKFGFGRDPSHPTVETYFMRKQLVSSD